MNNRDSAVETYFASLNVDDRQILSRIRVLIKQEVPSATESIAYGMPAFKYKAKPLMYYAAFKDHYSIFPTSGPIAELDKQLKPYKTAKGTVQFTRQNPLPEDIIKQLLRVRVDQIDSRL